MHAFQRINAADRKCANELVGQGANKIRDQFFTTGTDCPNPRLTDEYRVGSEGSRLYGVMPVPDAAVNVDLNVLSDSVRHIGERLGCGHRGVKSPTAMV